MCSFTESMAVTVYVVFLGDWCQSKLFYAWHSQWWPESSCFVVIDIKELKRLWDVLFNAAQKQCPWAWHGQDGAVLLSNTPHHQLSWLSQQKGRWSFFRRVLWIPWTTARCVNVTPSKRDTEVFLQRMVSLALLLEPWRYLVVDVERFGVICSEVTSFSTHLSRGLLVLSTRVCYCARTIIPSFHFLVWQTPWERIKLWGQSEPPFAV